MKNKQPALGKGLSALFPTASTGHGTSTIVECPLDRIDAMVGQPRQKFDADEIRELADSIKESGILQPLLVSKEGERYRLIAGERRLRAARIAGLSTVPIVVRQTTPKDAFVLALVENLQRSDLGPVEQALAFSRLSVEHKMTQEEIAKRVGKSRSAIANSLRILKLAEPVLESLAVGDISEGVGRALLPLTIDEQVSALETVRGASMSARETEAMVSRIKKTGISQTNREPPSMAAYFAEARSAIEDALGIPVSVTYKGNRGRISLAFGNLTQFKRIRDFLVGSGVAQNNKPPYKTGD